MSSAVLLSIHSTHAQNIYAGTKRYEYRTRKPNRDVSYIAMYETGNVQAITGVAKIAGILEGAPTKIWELTKPFAGISRDFFRSYYAGKKKAVAYCLGEVLPFKTPIALRELGVERAPQSFQYIDEFEARKLFEQGIENKKPLLPRFFVGGVHGVGKTTYVESIASDMGLSSYTASHLISEAAATGTTKIVSVDKAISNQELLLAGLRRTEWFANGGILDGYFVLRTEEAASMAIPSEVFAQLDLDAMFVMTKKPSAIAKNLKSRDGVDWENSVIDEMQKREMNCAKQIAEKLNIPLSVIR